MQQISISRRDLLDFLDQAELKYPVETWEIQGVHVWPLIKIDLFFRHVKSEGRDDELSSLILKQQRRSRIETMTRALIAFFRFILLFFKKKRQLDVFFSDSSGHRVMHKGAFINRYFKPIVDYFEGKNQNFSYLTINNDTDNVARYPSNEPLLFVHRYLLGAKLWRKAFEKRIRNKELTGYSDFCKELDNPRFEHLCVDKKFKNHIQHKVDDILAFSSIIQLLIKKHKPKVIFELCYYSTLRFGINHAASLTGTKTVEIQHGGMGRDHVSYCGWRKLPMKGYNLLPQTFWLWDESSKQLIESWTKGHGFHSAVLGGNPWLSYVKESTETYSFPQNRQIILYTLQYSEIPDHIIEVIKSTPARFQWWIRLHPRKLESKTVIIKVLTDSGIHPDQFEIEKATSYPLPTVLLNTHVHLSGSSGSIIEAAQMGVFSIILEEIGTIYYSDLITGGKAKAALSQKEIFETILAIEGADRLERFDQSLYKSLAEKFVFNK